LSNASFIFEILRNGDRVTAYPEELFKNIKSNMGGNISRADNGDIKSSLSPNVKSANFDENTFSANTNDITELLYMLKNV